MSIALIAAVLRQPPNHVSLSDKLLATGGTSEVTREKLLQLQGLYQYTEPQSRSVLSQDYQHFLCDDQGQCWKMASSIMQDPIDLFEQFVRCVLYPSTNHLAAYHFSPYLRRGLEGMAWAETLATLHNKPLPASSAAATARVAGPLASSSSAAAAAAAMPNVSVPQEAAPQDDPAPQEKTFFETIGDFFTEIWRVADPLASSSSAAAAAAMPNVSVPQEAAPQDDPAPQEKIFFETIGDFFTEIWDAIVNFFNKCFGKEAE